MPCNKNIPIYRYIRFCKKIIINYAFLYFCCKQVPTNWGTNFSFYHGIFVLDPDLYLLIRVPDPTFIIQIRIRITAEKERGLMQIFFCWWYQFYATPLLLLLLWAAVVPRPSHPTSWRSCDGPWSSSHYSREVREECSPIPIYIRYHTCCHWRSEKIVTGGDAVSSKGHFTTWSLIFYFF